MSVLFIAVPAAFAFAISAVIAFLWASRSGQLDDLDTPPLRMLHDEASRTASNAGQSSPGFRSGRRARDGSRARVQRVSSGSRAVR